MRFSTHRLDPKIRSQYLVLQVLKKAIHDIRNITQENTGNHETCCIIAILGITMEHNFYFASDASRGPSSEWLMLAENIKIKQCCESRSFLEEARLFSLLTWYQSASTLPGQIWIFSHSCVCFSCKLNIFGIYSRTWHYFVKTCSRYPISIVMISKRERGTIWCYLEQELQCYSPGRPIERVWVPFWRWFCPCCSRQGELICCNCWANHRKAAWRPDWAGPRPGTDREVGEAINAADPHPSFSC